MAYRRRGVTLVEALVALAVGVLALAAAWDVVRSCLGLGRRADASLQGASDVTEFAQRFQRDLLSLCWGPTRDVAVTEGGRAVTFWRFDDGASAPERGLYGAQRVTWRFEPSTGCILRQVGAASPESLKGSFAAFSVRLADLARGGGCSAVLRWSVTTGVPGASDGARRVLHTKLAGAVPLARLNARRQCPFWQPTPTNGGVAAD